MLSASFFGTVIDKNSKKPIPHAIISDANFSVTSDKNGTFNIKTSQGTVHIKSYGYRSLKLTKDLNTTVFELTPIKVKALYLSFWRANLSSKNIKNILKIVKNKEVNSIIVDVKNEYGSTSYKTSFQQANSYGAWHKRTIKDIKKFIELMHSHNIYLIARIVTFKDELQASNNPEYAIKKADGEIWRNHDEMGWVDPFDKRAHNYTISIAEDAAKVGFDEINFDYIRFPAKAGLKLSKPNTQENRIKAIGEFLESAKKRLRKYGVYISVDTYGNIFWTKKGDNNIGQTVESLAEHADYLAPMLYPSGFASGSFGKKSPSNYPFIVVYRSVKHVKDIINPSRVRPWLQYFKDYAHNKIYYRKFEINEQVRACEKLNTNGWMMWSPSSRYHINYFKK
jgi:hypothetical protein